MLQRIGKEPDIPRGLYVFNVVDLILIARFLRATMGAVAESLVVFHNILVLGLSFDLYGDALPLHEEEDIARAFDRIPMARHEIGAPIL
jgi:hypothetical protein